MKNDFDPLRPELAYAPIQNEDSTNIEQDTNSTTDYSVSAMRFDQTNIEPDDSSDSPQPSETKPKKQNKLQALWRKFQKLDRNKKIIILSAITGIVIFLCGLVWYYCLRSEPVPPPAPQPVVKQEEPPKPTTVPSPLTGIQVKPELAKLPTTGVMIENSPDARPQSGLYDAGVVFEAIAEGGITRFLALFQEAKPERIGPVRSVRPYYLDFLKPFDAPIAHAGGSGQALAELHSQGFKDLEAFQNPNYYERISTRYAPHNLYTGRSRLLELQKSKGWNTSKFTGFTRKEEKKSATPTAKSIDFEMSGFLYNPHFDYVAKNNSYTRSMAGTPHNDEAARKQINPKVVVALVMSHGYAGIYSVYGATGSGEAFIFQDGNVTKGTWIKKDRASQFKFQNSNKEELGLNPGQTWISIVSSSSAVTYKP